MFKELQYNDMGMRLCIYFIRNVSIKRMNILNDTIGRPIVEKGLNCIPMYKALVSFIIPCKVSICNYIILKK